MANLLFEFILIGLAGGLLGIFYRDCLKPKGMIFHKLYFKVFKVMVKKSREKGASAFHKFLSFIAYPLGFCIYCSTTWITIFLTLIYLSSWIVLPKWQDIVIGFIMALGVQHLVVVCACRFLIHNHPDLDIDLLKEQSTTSNNK